MAEEWKRVNDKQRRFLVELVANCFQFEDSLEDFCLKPTTEQGVLEFANAESYDQATRGYVVVQAGFQPDPKAKQAEIRHGIGWDKATICRGYSADDLYQGFGWEKVENKDYSSYVWIYDQTKKLHVRKPLESVQFED